MELARGTSSLRRVARRGVLPFFVTVTRAGTITAKATVDRATARRLRVGRRTTRVGTAGRSVSAPGRVKVNVRLTRKARRGLARQRRSLRIKVRARFLPESGGAALTRTISLRLRPT